MKKKIFLIALLTLYSNSTMTMQQSTIEITIEQKIETLPTGNYEYIQYLQQCLCVNEKQEQKLTKSINSSNNENYKYDLKSTQTELQRLALKFEAIELRHEKELLQEFNITGDSKRQFLSAVSRLQDLEKKSQHLPMLNTTHDKKIPKSFKTIIKSSLVKKGINPHRITICVSDNSNTMGITSPCPQYQASELMPLLCTKTIPASQGMIILSHADIPFKNQIIVAQLYAESINQKKTLLSTALLNYASVFNTTAKEILNNKYYKKYNFIIQPSTALSLALENQENAHNLHAFHSIIQITYGHITALSFYKQLSKIKRHWNFLEWLQNYRSLYTRLILKKDPTKEPVTSEELKFWQKNNHSLCLPIRCNIANSLNPFDVLQTQSFSKQYTGKQDMLMYQLLTAQLKNLPVYEHEKANPCIDHNVFLLKQLNPNEYNIHSLVEKYGKKNVKKAIAMANAYAARKNKNSILSLKILL